MNSKSYFKITGLIFLVIAVVHLTRAFKGWEVNIHTLEMPMWVSWVGAVIAGCLAYHGLTKK